MLNKTIFAFFACLFLTAGCSPQSDGVATKPNKTEVMGSGHDVVMPKQSDYKKEP